MNLAIGTQVIPNMRINYEFRADMKTSEYGPMTEEELIEEGVVMESAPALGEDLGGDHGVGLIAGIKCIEGNPLGEDKLNYCKELTQEQESRRKQRIQGL